MLQVQLYPLVFRADDLHVANQFFRMRIVEKEREALRGFVGQPSPTRLLPRQLLFKYMYGISRARELLAAHCPGRPTTYYGNLRHLGNQSLVSFLLRCGKKETFSGRSLYETGNTTRQNPARSI